MKRETEGEDDILVMVEFHLSTQLRHRPGLGDMAMEKTHLTPNTKPQATSNNTKDTNLIIWHTSTQPTLFFKPSNAIPPISSAITSYSFLYHVLTGHRCSQYRRSYHHTCSCPRAGLLEPPSQRSQHSCKNTTTPIIIIIIRPSFIENKNGRRRRRRSCFLPWNILGFLKYCRRVLGLPLLGLYDVDSIGVSLLPEITQDLLVHSNLCYGNIGRTLMLGSHESHA